MNTYNPRVFLSRGCSATLRRHEVQWSQIRKQFCFLNISPGEKLILAVSFLRKQRLGVMEVPGFIITRQPAV